jgi:hypothetical protein
MLRAQTLLMQCIIPMGGLWFATVSCQVEQSYPNHLQGRVGMQIKFEREARTVAEQALLDKRHDFQIDKARIEERAFGWVYRYYPKLYFETRDPDDLVPGMGPLLVLRDGTFQFLSTERSPSAKIDEFEADWIRRNQGTVVR